MFKKLILFLFLLFMFSCNLFKDDYVINRTTNNSTDIVTTPGWLIMIYISGSGNLEEESITDFENIKTGYESLSSTEKENIDIVILHDRAPGFSTLDGDWVGTKLYKSSSTSLTQVNSVSGWRETSEQEENMGSKETLNQFITWSKNNYKRAKQALIIWNHGGGLSAQVLPESRAVSWDTENTKGDINDCLYINEIQSVLKTQYNSHSKLDILGFDACFMGMVEIAYEFRDEVNYLVASPGLETGGWRYNTIISDLELNTTPETLTKNIVTTYKDFSLTNSLDNSLTSINISKVKILKENIDNLSIKLLEQNKDNIITKRNNSIKYFDNSILNDEKLYPYIDLGSFTELLESITDLENESILLKESLKECVVLTFGQENSNTFFYENHNRGVSIFFSGSSEDYNYQWWYTGNDTGTYGNVDFCKNGSSLSPWKELMDLYFD